MADDSRLISLVPTVAPDGQIYDLHEDGTVPKGQLRRFLMIMGPTLDEAKGLVDSWQNMLDVDKTDADLLPLVAPIVGVEFNREIPIEQAREEVKGAVAGYKQKGTVAGMAARTYLITRMQTDVVEFVKNIRTANREYSFSANITDGAKAILFGLPGDETAFSYDFELVDRLVKGPESVSSYAAGHEAWKALDNVEVSSWKASADAPGWWAYHSPTAFILAVVNLKAGAGVKNFVVQFSDNGSDWNYQQEFKHGVSTPNATLMGTATGATQALYLKKVPVDKDTVTVNQMTGYDAAVDTTLQDDAAEGDAAIAVVSSIGIAIGDWLELYDGVKYGYCAVYRIEGNRLTLGAPVGEAGGFSVGATVKKVTYATKSVATDYLLDPMDGTLSLVAGQFTAGARVFMAYESLVDKTQLETWQRYAVDATVIAAHEWWRIYVTDTWTGTPEINELEMSADELVDRFYRADRLGFFFTLGVSRQGCGIEQVCNLPLDREIVDKMCRLMVQIIPAGTTPVMIALDCHYPEVVMGNVNAEDARVTSAFNDPWDGKLIP